MTAVRAARPVERGAPSERLPDVRPRERAPADRPFLYLNMVSTRRRPGEPRGHTRARSGGRRHACCSASCARSPTRSWSGPGPCAPRATRGWSAIRAASRGGTPPGCRGPGRGADLALARRAVGRRRCSRRRTSPCSSTRAPAATPPAVAAPVELVRRDDASPAAVLADLRARGVRALLCEGGPTLNRALLADGLRRRALPHARRRCSSGDAGRARRSSPAGARPRPRGSQLRWVLRHGDELYLR